MSDSFIMQVLRRTHCNSISKAQAVIQINVFNSFLASGDFCYLLIIFANSLDPYQDRHSVGPDLGPNCLTF